MLGAEVVDDRLPYLYTDQRDLGMQYTGYAAAGGYETVVVRGGLASRQFIAFWTTGGRIMAGMNVNVWDVTADIQQLIQSAREVDLAQLADPDVPLNELTTAVARSAPPR